MGLLSDIGNKVVCSIAELIGGGNDGCLFDFENLAGGEIRLWKPNTVHPATTDYNRAYIRAQQQAGNVVILNNIYNFAWNNEANTIITADGSGLEGKADDGKYKVQLMWKKGLYNQKQLSAFSIDNYWEVQLIDAAGNELWARNSAGAYVGFKTALCTADPITFKTRSTDQLTGLTVQFSTPKQFNDDLAWITADQLDYGVGELDGANQVNLLLTVPTNLDTTLVVKTVLAKDGNSFVTGLAIADFLVKVDGATVVPTLAVADATAKTYTLTIAALATGETVTVQNYDGTANSTTIIVGTIPADKVYKSNTTTQVVVA